MTEPTYHLLPDAVVWAVDDAETVALDLGTGGYVGMNSSGTLLWSALQNGATCSQLAAQLREQYGLDAQRAAADAQAFIEACRRRGFLVD